MLYIVGRVEQGDVLFLLGELPELNNGLVLGQLRPVPFAEFLPALGLVGEPFMFVLSGGIFRAVPWLREELERRLPVAAPGSITELLAREPAAGAVALAIKEAAGGTVVPSYKRD